MGKFIDLTGLSFGKWRALSTGGLDNSGKILWRCQCSCGDIHLVIGNTLRNGRSKGCVKCASHGKRHGHSRTSTYKVWDCMIQRCCNSNHKSFSDYGGRGIGVCEEWRQDFAIFLRDMGVKPPHLTLDRIDNDRGYSKDNCQWATMKQQNRNRRTSPKIGDVFHGWKLLERFDSPDKSRFQCVHCDRIIMYDTSHVKTGRKSCSCSHIPIPV